MKSPVQTPAWIFKRFPPDQRSAVDYFRSLIDEEMLQEIAAADHSQDVEKHLAALKPIWAGGELTSLHYWFPMEVLELTRWLEPENSGSKPDSTGSRDHLMRGFACAILLATPNFEPNKETLIQMLDSVFALGQSAEEAFARFLTWQIDTLGRESDRPFFALALAAILQSLERDLPTVREQEVAGWILEEESLEREYLAGFNAKYQTSPWLFGLSFKETRNERWNALIQRMLRGNHDRPMARLLLEQHKA